MPNRHQPKEHLHEAKATAKGRSPTSINPRLPKVSRGSDHQRPVTGLQITFTMLSKLREESHKGQHRRRSSTSGIIPKSSAPPGGRPARATIAERGRPCRHKAAGGAGDEYRPKVHHAVTEGLRWGAFPRRFSQGVGGQTSCLDD